MSGSSGIPQAPTPGNVGSMLQNGPMGEGFGPMGLKGGNSFSSYAPGGRPSNGRPAQLTDEFNPAMVEARAYQAANPIANYGDPNGTMSAWGRHLQQQQIAQGITPPTGHNAPQYGTPGNVAPTPYGWTDQAWQQQQAQQQQQQQMNAQAPAPAGTVQGPGLAGAMMTGNPAYQGPPPEQPPMQGGALGGYSPNPVMGQITGGGQQKGGGQPARGPQQKGGGRPMMSGGRR